MLIHIPELLSDQDISNGLVNIKIASETCNFVYICNLFDVKDVNHKCLHEKYKI